MVDKACGIVWKQPTAYLWWCSILELIFCSMIVIYNQMINGMFGQLSCIITQCNQMIDTMSIFDTISSSFSSPFFNIDTMFRHFNFYLLQPWTFWDESCILHWTKHYMGNEEFDGIEILIFYLENDNIQLLLICFHIFAKGKVHMRIPKLICN